MKKIITLFITACAISCPMISAQTLPSLLVSSDAAGLGKASATVSGSANAFALENNAATMSLGESKVQAGVSYGIWQPSYSKNNIIAAGATAKIASKFALGLEFKKFGMPSYEKINSEGQVSGTFNPGEWSAGIGAAYSITDWLSAGVTGRMTKSSLGEDASASVFGADVALFYKKEALSAGLSVNNIGGKVNYGGNDYDQPMLAKAGASYRFGNPEASSVTPSLEADILFKGGFMAGAGVEYSFKEMLFARGGFHYGDKEKAVPTYVSLGLGVRFFGVSLDVAYLTASEVLGNSMSFGLSYRF